MHPIGHRETPGSIEVEQALLGAILINNEAYYHVSDFLRAEHFLEAVHATIFQVVGQLIEKGKVATPITAKTVIGDVDLGAGVPVMAYLVRLAGEATTVINSKEYGRIIYELALRRGLIHIGSEIVNNAYDAPVEGEARVQIEEAERSLFKLAEKGQTDGGIRAFSESLSKSIEMAAAAYKRDGGLSGLATGFRDIDKMMGGLQSSDLVIIAGRPAMGKTALATNISYNVAQAYKAEKQEDGTLKTINGGVVLFFSLEMSDEQLATRIVSEQTGISSSDIRRGLISEDDFGNIVGISKSLVNLSLHIDPTGGMNIAQLAARARRFKRQKGLDLIIVDYLQLMTGRSENRVQEITEITTGLKALAKELDVPIVALSQLSRQVEQRPDKRPQLSDLRESGSIEQDADVVLFVYREEYYLQREMPEEGSDKYHEWLMKLDNQAGKAELIIGKQRHGPTGTVPLAFNARVTRFADLVEEDRLPERH